MLKFHDQHDIAVSFHGWWFDDDSHGSTYTKRADLIHMIKIIKIHYNFSINSVLAGHGSASNLFKMGDKSNLFNR